MKKPLLALLAFSLVFMFSFSYAHPPSSIDLFFRSGDNTLKVEVNHSSDASDHFIKQVTVKLNGKTIITQTLSEQPNRYFVTLDYRIPEAQRGDEITVTATCSKEGSLEKTITVG